MHASDPDPHGMVPGGRVAVVCFLSGAAALVFEAVWFHRAGLVFGSSVWSTSLVLSSFMGGLALGGGLVACWGGRISRALPAYAALELMVAVSGVILTLALPELTRTLAGVVGPAETGWLHEAVRAAIAFAVLLVPSTAMGATLPLLVAAPALGRAGFGPALGQLYGWNTLGAVVGVVGAEVWLIRWLGVAGSAVGAALLSLAAAATAVWVSRRADAGPRRPEPAPPAPATSVSSAAPPHGPEMGPPGALLLAAFLAGLTLLALEVVWFRFLTMYVLSTTLAASLMLAVVLAAIGLGGLAASAWLRRQARATGSLPALAFATGAAVVAAYAAFQTVGAGTQIQSWPRIVGITVALAMVPSLLSGALFTLLGAALQRQVRTATRASGALLLANTAGATIGPLAAAFWLLPAFGMEGAFFALAAVYVVIGVSAGRGVGMSWVGLRSPGLVAGAAALAVALVGFPFGLMRDVYFARVAEDYADDGSELVATREGPSETIFLMQQRWMDAPIYSRLVTNGFSMSGTASSGQRYMRYFAYWPMVLHRGPIDRALVICYGVGVTADAVLDIPGVTTVDIAEISPDVVAMSDVLYAADHPLRDPRVRLHIADGRQFLHTTETRYDLITGEPPPPRTPGAVNIYTREYFQLIHDRLADGGIATYWLPVARPDPGTNVNAIIRAFCDVFADCSLWNATPFDFMLVGTRGTPGPGSVEAFAAPWREPALRRQLVEIGLELPQQIGATFLADAAALRELTAQTPPLTDDRPRRLVPDRAAPSLSDPGYGVDAGVTALYDRVLDPDRARRAFTASALIRRLWPDAVREASLPYFEHQRMLNRVLWDGGRPLSQIEHLHWLLTETPLQTLPLWILGSDHVKQRVVLGRDQGSAAAYGRALTLLVRRDYRGAATALAEAERLGLRDHVVRALLVYALSVAGDLDEAGARAPARPPADAEARHFWTWLASTYGIGPMAPDHR